MVLRKLKMVQSITEFQIGCMKVLISYAKKITKISRHLFSVIEVQKIIKVIFLYFTEEIIGDNSALWFSPDGSRIAYVRFNDSLVSELSTLRLFYSWFYF